MRKSTEEFLLEFYSPQILNEELGKMKLQVMVKEKDVREERFTWEAGDVVWEKKPSDKEEEEKEDASKTPATKR